MKIIFQLPKPFLLLSDVNAHITLWGNKSTDVKGGIFEKKILVTEIFACFTTIQIHICIWLQDLKHQ